MAGSRLFSTDFCAALLADLGAAAVVSFDEPSPPAAADAQRAAFAAAGLAYCGPDDLCVGAGGRGISLQSLDRFLALVAGSEGPVAVQCRLGAAGGAARTHLAALMLRGYFPAAAEAEAWMRMVVPGRPAGPIDLEMLEGLRATAPAGRRGRARSLSISVCAGVGAAPLVGVGYTRACARGRARVPGVRSSVPFCEKACACYGGGGGQVWATADGCRCW